MKSLIDKIIEDLGNDKPIKGILLRSQILASKLGNDEFSSWISNEQNGYPNAKNIPSYRVLDAFIKADIFLPYKGLLQNYTIPRGIFEEEYINESMSSVRVTQSLSEIERLCKGNENKNIMVSCPALVYPEVNKYVNGCVERVWRELPGSSFLGIVDSFKSRLLSFFIDLDRKINTGVDFSKIEEQREIGQIMNTYNINAIVANTGEGSVSTGDILDSQTTQYISDIEKKRQLQDLIDELREEASKITNQDLLLTLEVISEECKKPSWSKRVLRMAFQAVQGIAVGITANQITPIVTQALALL